MRSEIIKPGLNEKTWLCIKWKSVVYIPRFSPQSGQWVHFFGEGGEGGSEILIRSARWSDPISDLPLSDLPLSDLPLSDLPLSDLPLSDHMRIQNSKFKLSDPVVRSSSKFMYRAFRTWRIDCECSRSPVTTPSYCSSIRMAIHAHVFSKFIKESPPSGFEPQTFQLTAEYANQYAAEACYGKFQKMYHSYTANDVMLFLVWYTPDNKGNDDDEFSHFLLAIKFMNY